MTEQDLINEFNNLTQLAYGLCDITSVIADTTPKYNELRKIEEQTEKNIKKFIKKHFNDKYKTELKIQILKYLTDTGGDYNGNDTLGRRRLNYCDNPKKHTEDKYDCCYAVYIKELEAIEYKIAEQAKKDAVREQQEEEVKELEAEREERFTGKWGVNGCNIGHKNICRNCLKGTLIIGRPNRNIDEQNWSEIEKRVYPYEDWCLDCCGGEKYMGSCIDNKNGMTNYLTGEMDLTRKCKCGCWNEEAEEEEDIEEQVVFKGNGFKA